MAANSGETLVPRPAAINNGLRLITPAALVTGSSINPGARPAITTTAGNSVVPPTGDSRGVIPVDIPNSPVWGTLDVNSNGDLFLVGLNFDTAQIWCERSTSAKNAALTPAFEQSTAVNLGGQIGSSLVINPEGLAGQLFLAVDRSGTSSNNNVYLLASVISTGFTKTDVMFVRSTDSGVTFSPPRRVNDDPNDHSKWHWFGALAVAPNGRLDAVWRIRAMPPITPTHNSFIPTGPMPG